MITNVVPPGTFFEVFIDYCPRDTNPHRAELNLQHNADTQIGPGGSDVTVPLLAEGGGQCRVVFDPQLDFGTIQAGTTADRFVAITNIGNAICGVITNGLSGTSSTGEFTMIDPMPFNLDFLDPGQQRLIQIRFSPSFPGSFFDQLTLNTDDLNNPMITIPVFGNAIQPQGGFRIEIVPVMPALTPGARVMFTPSDDDGSAAINIPFPFTFLGRPVSQVFVSSNGFITFDNAGVTNLRGEPMPSPNPPNSFIAFWWDDLHPFRSGTMGVVTSLVTGAVAPFRQLVITYRDVAPFGGPTTVTVSGSIRLLERNSSIEVEYGQLTDRMNASFAATAGWEGPFGMSGADALGCSPNCTAGAWPTNTLIRYIPIP